MPRLQNLDVSIQPHDGGHYTCVAASPSGEARTDFDLPFTDKDLQILVLSVLGSIGSLTSWKMSSRGAVTACLSHH